MSHIAGPLQQAHIEAAGQRARDLYGAFTRAYASRIFTDTKRAALQGDWMHAHSAFRRLIDRRGFEEGDRARNTVTDGAFAGLVGTIRHVDLAGWRFEFDTPVMHPNIPDDGGTYECRSFSIGDDWATLEPVDEAPTVAPPAEQFDAFESPKERPPDLARALRDSLTRLRGENPHD